MDEHNFDKEHAKTQPRDEWVKAHAHAGSKKELEAMYDKLVKKPAKEEEK